jgi:hypothetical protein
MTTAQITRTTATITNIHFEDVWVNGLRRVATITLDSGLVLRTRPGHGAGQFSPAMVGETLTFHHRGDIFVTYDD